MTTETNTPANATPEAPKAKRTRKPAASKAKAKAKAPTKAKAPASSKAKTFTSVDIAAEHGINAKTLRARIRRNIDKWEPLFKDGERHVFADNATTRKAVAALLDA